MDVAREHLRRALEHQPAGAQRALLQRKLAALEPRDRDGAVSPSRDA
jgi:hypothetical protein